MYPLPDDILSYVHIDQSVILSVLSGAFLLPVPLLIGLALFWCWQEDMLREHHVDISRLEAMGFVIKRSMFLPSCGLIRSQEQIHLYITPLFAWISIVHKDKTKIRKSLNKTHLLSFIDSLDPVEPISKPRGG